MSETELNDLMAQLNARSAEFKHVIFPYNDCASAYEQYGDVLCDIFENANTYVDGIDGFAS